MKAGNLNCEQALQADSKCERATMETDIDASLASAVLDPYNDLLLGILFPTEMAPPGLPQLNGESEIA
jgi:hypothetical protein